MTAVDNPIDPALFERDDLRPVLAERDIGALYQALNDAGISQRRIATLTGQSQSEVSEIARGGRLVENYGLLVRIGEGLGIPRERMGLSYSTCGEGDTYSEGVTVAEPPEGVDEGMLRESLTAALDTRPGRDARKLARTARQVAATLV